MLGFLVSFLWSVCLTLLMARLSAMAATHLAPCSVWWQAPCMMVRRPFTLLAAMNFSTILSSVLFSSFWQMMRIFVRVGVVYALYLLVRAMVTKYEVQSRSTRLLYSTVLRE